LDQNFWADLYDAIVSIPKEDAIAVLRSLSNNGAPLISATRAQRLQRDIANLREDLCFRDYRGIVEALRVQQRRQIFLI
jgi:hypothetical protein